MELTTALRLDELRDTPCIALTGAGGKSTLLFRLGGELAASRQTLLTTTTHLGTWQADLAPFTLVSANEALMLAELPVSLRGYRQVLATAGPAAEPDRLRGLSPQTVCRLAGLPEVEALVVEADGSRQRPLKAPASHEPAVPPCATHVITVVGMDALGRPLTAEHVHRPELVASLTGLPLGDAITPLAIARLAVHPQGGLKGHPAAAQSLLYLNLMEQPDPALLAAARWIAAAVLRSPAGGQRYRSVLIGSPRAATPATEVHGRVAAVVLAAGRGSRLAGDLPKPLLPWRDGGTLVGRAVDSALAADGVDEVLAVVGYQAGTVEAALASRPVRIVHSLAWQEGQAASVRAAIAALPADASAALFLLADQPTVTAQTIGALIEAHRRSLAPAVAPIYQGGRRGNPVLFDRAAFADLAALTGDAGGRALLEPLGDRVLHVAIDQPQPEGIETWEDYRRMQG